MAVVDDEDVLVGPTLSVRIRVDLVPEAQSKRLCLTFREIQMMKMKKKRY